MPDCLQTLDGSATLYIGHALDVLRSLPDESVQCVVTSPPYWGLRDYETPPVTFGDGWSGQMGHEETPALYVVHMVEIFDEVRRVLRGDGTLWLNMGDSYCSDGRTSTNASDKATCSNTKRGIQGRSLTPPGLKTKDMVGMPWRLALALQAAGWWLRDCIIWHKPSPMPEGVKDRTTKAHEYIFLLAKSATYTYDADAIKEPVSGNAHTRGKGVHPKAKVPSGWDTGPGSHKEKTGRYRPKQNESFSAAVSGLVEMRNKRSVWKIPSSPYPGSHFATFPPKLVEPCILAGCPEGYVMDPFMGAGTTGMVALQLGRPVIGIELSQTYARRHAWPRIEKAAESATVTFPKHDTQLPLFGGQND